MVAELAAAELPGGQGKGKPGRLPSSPAGPAPLRCKLARPRPTCVGAGPPRDENDSLPTFGPFGATRRLIPT